MIFYFSFELDRVFNAIFLMKAMLEAMTDYRSKVNCWNIF